MSTEPAPIEISGDDREHFKWAIEYALEQFADQGRVTDVTVGELLYIYQDSMFNMLDIYLDRPMTAGEKADTLRAVAWCDRFLGSNREAEMREAMAAIEGETGEKR